jgi:hypothetical protein
MFDKFRPRVPQLDAQSLLELTIAAEVIYAPHGLSEVAEEVAHALGLESPTPEAMIGTATILARRLFDQIALPLGTSREDAFYEITNSALEEIWYWETDAIYLAAEVLGPIILCDPRSRRPQLRKPVFIDPDFVVDALVRFVLALSVMYARVHTGDPTQALVLASK